MPIPKKKKFVQFENRKRKSSNLEMKLDPQISASYEKLFEHQE